MTHGIRALALMVLLMSFASFAGAATVGGPTVGLWYNADETGRGYGIDIQGDTMIVTTYIYTTDGDPIWYLSSGPYNHVSGVFQSSYDSYSDGQCFGCPWQAPTLHSNAAGPIIIVFHTNQSATLSFDGGTTEIVKYNYAFPVRSDALYGEWAFSFEDAGTIDGDWLVFDHTYTDSTGKVFVAGGVVGAGTNVALGFYNTTTREVEITVTRGTTQHLYRMGVFDDRRAIGLASVVEGTQTGPLLPAVGARLLFGGELVRGIIGGPGNTPGPATGSLQQMPEEFTSAMRDDQDIAAQTRRAMAEYIASKK